MLPSRVRPELRLRASVLGLLLALDAAAVLGCGVREKKPLFSFFTPAPAPPPTYIPRFDPAQEGAKPNLLRQPAPVESASLTRMSIDELLADLRKRHAAGRRETVDRIISLGPDTAAEVEKALEEARFDSDILFEVENRVREASQPKAAPERKRSVAAPWADEKYRMAVDLYLAGDYFRATAVVDAILLLEPNPASRVKLDRLRHRARDQIIAETVVSATIAPVASVIALDRKLQARLVLENKLKEEVVFRLVKGQPLGQLDFDYEEQSWDGTRSLRRTSRRIMADTDIRLPPQGRFELELDVPTEHSAKVAGLVGRYGLSARLRPFALFAGQEMLPYFLPTWPVHVVVVDPEDAALAVSPGESFAAAVKSAQAALEEGREKDAEAAARSVFTAALVWECEDHDAAVGAAMKALEPATGILARSLCTALARATGEPGSFSKEEWIGWWKGGRGRPRTARPNEGPFFRETEAAEDDDLPRPNPPHR